ncbi:MAG: prepilin-type N-terminal cleavage/methylation domain-containing protein [Planctomycetota bacterium]
MSTSRRNGFTLIELLVVISIIALLIGLLLPSLAAARETARSISCSSKMRQLSLAAEIYANDSDGKYPTRNANPRWPEQFRETIQTQELLVCPNAIDPVSGTMPEVTEEFDLAPRSYIFNGFNDLRSDGSAVDPNNPAPGEWTENDDTTMPQAALVNLSEVIFFGEKEDDNPSYYVDIFANTPDPFDVLEQSRHGGTGNPERGGVSNYAFGDVSVRSFGFNETVLPENFWAITAAARRRP